MYRILHVNVYFLHAQDNLCKKMCFFFCMSIFVVDLNVILIEKFDRRLSFEYENRMQFYFRKLLQSERMMCV